MSKKLEENKVVDTLNPDKRFKKKYSLQLMEYVNQNIRPDEQGIYKELLKVLINENKLTKPQDLLMLDVALYDFLRIKRLQGLIMKDGDMLTITTKGGTTYKKSNEAGYLLNSVSTQFRNMMKEIGLTGKERLKTQLGVESKDFASFMSETVEVEAEEVENGTT